MRTTLKRGVNRGDRNGRVRRPPRPPSGAGASLGPSSRYVVWRPSKLRLAGKVVMWLLVAALVAAGALGGGIWLYLSDSVAAVRAHSEEVKQSEQFLDAPLPGQPTTAILIGYDARIGPESDAGRSDTVMLLRVDPQRDTLALMSFPRDLVVDHPGCQGQGPWRDRINTAFTLCGPSGTVRTVKQLTGVPINYVIVVNFRAFQQIVNQVGGVYLDVDQRYFNDNSGADQYATIDLEPGYQKVFGASALDYARYRHFDSDFHRIARQQEFVKAFKQQIESSFSVFKLPGVIDVITDTVEVGRGGKENLDLETVLGYARFIYDLPSGHFFQARIDGLTGFAELEAPTGSIEDAVREFLNPDVEAAEKATQVASGKKATSATPLPAETTIEVLNGNGVEGSADTAAYLLSQLGYQAVHGGNADPDGDGVANYDYFETEVVYDPAAAGAAAAAEEVGNLFGDAEVVAAGPDTDISTMLKVVVGQTFHGTIADAPIDETPEHQEAAVVNDSSDIRPLLDDLQRRVGFPLFVPTVKEQTSTLDSSVPVRAYRVEGSDAVRIVYRTAAGDYWGVQQLAWSEAPILLGPSVTRTIAGREYRLYYNGSRLHLVAFEESGVVYWVSNTLLDKLSNETMLAIARGLRPLEATP